jgi:hypothetical protein
MLERGEPAVEARPNIIELRSYPMRHHGRDSFIDNFEAHYLTEIERFGAVVLGQFRDIGNPDRFVWLRGFPDMERRRESLHGFYGGEVWKRHGHISVALFVRPLTVHLLRPLPGTDLTAGQSLTALLAAFAGGTISPDVGIVAVDTFVARDAKDRDNLAAAIAAEAELMGRAGIAVRGLLVAEESPTEGEEVIQDNREVVLFSAHESYEAAIRQRAEVRPAAIARLERFIAEPPGSQLLLPTMRSAMRYR